MSFEYEPMFQLDSDTTSYRLITKEHVTVEVFRNREVLCVDPQALTLLAAQAFHDINFFLRPAHLEQTANISGRTSNRPRMTRWWP